MLPLWNTERVKQIPQQTRKSNCTIFALYMNKTRMVQCIYINIFALNKKSNLIP